jgi:hypothetical protein
MREQKGKKEKDQAAHGEETATDVSRRIKKYIIDKEIFTKLTKQREEHRRRARRYAVNTDLLEVNGTSGNGSKIIDLSMNGARLELPFSPPFMSQITLKFALEGSQKILRVVGRVIWSKMTFQRGWYEVGAQFYQNYWEIDQLLRLQQR